MNGRVGPMEEQLDELANPLELLRVYQSSVVDADVDSRVFAQEGSRCALRGTRMHAKDGPRRAKDSFVTVSKLIGIGPVVLEEHDADGVPSKLLQHREDLECLLTLSGLDDSFRIVKCPSESRLRRNRRNRRDVRFGFNDFGGLKSFNLP